MTINYKTIFLTLGFILSPSLISQSRAEERGFLLTIKDKISDWTNFSSSKGETALLSTNKSSKVSSNLPPRCSSDDIFQQNSYRETTGLSLLDILAAGCDGNLKKKTKTFKNDQTNVEEQDFDEKIKIFMSKRSRVLVIVVDKFGLDLNNLKSSDVVIAPPFSGGQVNKGNISEKFPTIILGQTYETSHSHTSTHFGTKHSYSLKYKIDTTLNEKLKIAVSGKALTNTNNINETHEFIYQFDCTGKSIAEIIGKAQTQNNERLAQELKNKIFGKE